MTIYSKIKDYSRRAATVTALTKSLLCFHLANQVLPTGLGGYSHQLSNQLGFHRKSFVCEILIVNNVQYDYRSFSSTHPYSATLNVMVHDAFIDFLPSNNTRNILHTRWLVKIKIISFSTILFIRSEYVSRLIVWQRSKISKRFNFHSNDNMMGIEKTHW